MRAPASMRTGVPPLRAAPSTWFVSSSSSSDDQAGLDGGAAELARALVAAVLEEHVVRDGRDRQAVVEHEGAVHPVEEAAGVVGVGLADADADELTGREAGSGGERDRRAGGVADRLDAAQLDTSAASGDAQREETVCGVTAAHEAQCEVADHRQVALRPVAHRDVDALRRRAGLPVLAGRAVLAGIALRAAARGIAREARVALVALRAGGSGSARSSGIALVALRARRAGVALAGGRSGKALVALVALGAGQALRPGRAAGDVLQPGDRALGVAVGALGDLRGARELLRQAPRAPRFGRADRGRTHRGRGERRQCEQREEYGPAPALHPSLH